MFAIVDEKGTETKCTITTTTSIEKRVITRGQRTKLFIERKTYILHVLKSIVHDRWLCIKECIFKILFREVISTSMRSMALRSHIFCLRYFYCRNKYRSNGWILSVVFADICNRSPVISSVKMSSIVLGSVWSDQESNNNKQFLENNTSRKELHYIQVFAMSVIRQYFWKRIWYFRKSV
jgi:hypothetical protein